MYVSAYVALVGSGLAVPTSPVLVTQAAQDPALVLTATAGTPSFSVAFTSPSAGYSLAIFASRQVNPGVAWATASPGATRLTVKGSAAMSPYDGVAQYQFRWGALREGKQIWLRGLVFDPNGLNVGESVQVATVGA